MTNTEGFTGRAGNPDPLAGYTPSDRLPPVEGESAGDPLASAPGLTDAKENPWSAGAPLPSGPVAGAPGSWAEPPATGNWSPPAAPGGHGEPSTAEVAKDQAASVAGGAVDAAKDVAGVAKEQVAQVATEARQQVKNLVGQARSELTDQAQVQQDRAASGLHSLADQLRSMAEGSSEPGVATDLAHEASDKAKQLASWLENRDPGSVLDEVRSFARQRPGVFLALSLGAGIVAGRLARGLAADPQDTGSAATSTPALTREPPVRPVLNPSPASAVGNVGAPGFGDAQTFGGVGR